MESNLENESPTTSEATSVALAVTPPTSEPEPPVAAPLSTTSEPESGPQFGRPISVSPLVVQGRIRPESKEFGGGETRIYTPDDQELDSLGLPTHREAYNEDYEYEEEEEEEHDSDSPRCMHCGEAMDVEDIDNDIFQCVCGNCGTSGPRTTSRERAIEYTTSLFGNV